MREIPNWLRRRLETRLRVPKTEFGLERLARCGFRPRLIFDVGAYEGMIARACLALWPDVSIACFEVLPDKLAMLRQLTEHHPGVRLFPCLLGAKSKQSVVLHEVESASSILVEHVNQSFPTSSHPMRTIDEICAEHYDGRAPDFLKLDVQGYELEVLKGAERALPGMQAILAELNALDIHQQVPLLDEIVRWLSDRGWVAYDICALHRRPLDDALWQADFIFVPRASALRADKRWEAAAMAHAG
jgi:FkbM family methyltransferase